MHKIFITDGIVLNKRGVGEANTLVTLLTLEMGLVCVFARSARFDRSKLRYGLEAMTQARFSMVRGKYEWKLTGLERHSRTFLTESSSRRSASGRVARLLLRLIHGEEPLPELYATVAEGLEYLARATTDQDADSIECVLVLRILAQLGYLPQTPETQPFLEKDFFATEMITEVARVRPALIHAINVSLGATGL